MEDKIALIREKVIAANPEIVEMHTTFCDMDESGGYYRNCKRSKCVMRDIRLADVLLAIGDDLAVVGSKTGLGCFIQFQPSQANPSKGTFWNNGNILWNLRKDNLEDQSEETINFLWELLK